MAALQCATPVPSLSPLTLFSSCCNSFSVVLARIPYAFNRDNEAI